MRGAITALLVLASAVLIGADERPSTGNAVAIAEEAIALYSVPSRAQFVTTVDEYGLGDLRRHVNVKAFVNDDEILSLDVIVTGRRLVFLSAIGSLLRSRPPGSAAEKRHRAIDFLERRSRCKFERNAPPFHEDQQRLLFLDPFSTVAGLTDKSAILTKESVLILFGTPE